MGEVWLTTKEVADIENTTERTIRRRLKSGVYKIVRQVPLQSGGGKSGLRTEIALSCLSVSAKARYAERTLKSGPHLEHNMMTGDDQDFDLEPQYKKDEAYRWLAVIKEFESYAAKGKKKRVKAGSDFCLRYLLEHPEEKPFSQQTLFRKISCFRQHGIDGLVNGYGKTRNVAAFSREARAWVTQKYLNINQPTAKWCMSELKAEAAIQGWILPSEATVLRLLRTLPSDEVVRYREGEKAWRQKCLPSVLRDYEEMVPGEVFVADHAQINVAVRHPSGRVIFPWFSGWMDMRTRKILGWHLSDMPNGDTVNLSLKYTLEKYGVPEHVIIDNGRDFSMSHFSGGQKRFRFRVNEDETLGIYSLMGIDAHFCIPANAQAKSIERWFWTLESQFQKAFPTYRGNNIQNRPEGVDARIKKEKDVFEWEEFLPMMDNFLERYNQDHSHRGHGMDGRTPNEIWNKYYMSNSLRRVAPSSLRMLLLKSSRPVKVGRFGISAFKGSYRSDAIHDYYGQQLMYKYDPQDLSCIYVFSPKWEYICQAQRVHRTAWNDETAYKEIKSLEKRLKGTLKQGKEAREKLAQVNFGYTERPPSGDHPDTPPQVIEMVRTPVDGLQKRIDQEEEKVAAVGGGGLSMREYLDATKEEPSAPKYRVVDKLSYDPNFEEEF